MLFLFWSLAEKARRRRAKRDEDAAQVYRCPHGNHWHIGHVGEVKRVTPYRRSRLRLEDEDEDATMLAWQGQRAGSISVMAST
jgi:hypothetical protein